jgi:hypothetical protein
MWKQWASKLSDDSETLNYLKVSPVAHAKAILISAIHLARDDSGVVHI